MKRTVKGIILGMVLTLTAGVGHADEWNLDRLGSRLGELRGEITSAEEAAIKAYEPSLSFELNDSIYNEVFQHADAAAHISKVRGIAYSAWPVIAIASTQVTTAEDLARVLTMVTQTGGLGCGPLGSTSASVTIGRFLPPEKGDVARLELKVQIGRSDRRLEKALSTLGPSFKPTADPNWKEVSGEVISDLKETLAEVALIKGVTLQLR